MNLIQRYVFRKLLGAFLVAFPALSITIWATQALRQLSLVTDRGQGFGTFVEASLFLLPGLVLIVGPVTLLIVVIYTFNGLNGDSELVSLNASGASPGVLVKPVLAIALPVAILSMASSLYFNPIAMRGTNLLVAEANADVISALLRPGQFRTLGEDVVIQVKAVHPDGALEDIFVFDRRQPGQTAAYLARAGALVDDGLGKYLLMQDGVIQRKSTGTDAVSVIEFQSYTFDLTLLAARSSLGDLRPNERGLAYLLDPDPNDPIHQANPFRYSAELHNRLTVPFYVFVLALVSAALLGPVRSARLGRVRRTTATAALSGFLLGANLYFGGALENNVALLPLVYGVPFAAIGIPILFLVTGRQLQLPPWLRWRGPAMRRLRRSIGAA